MSPRLRNATGDTFRSFKSRNFRLYFMGQGISQIGTWLTMLAQSLLVYEITHSGIALGVLVACQFLPVLLLGAWAGLIVDRSDKRQLLIVAQVIAMLQSFALAAAALTHRPSVFLIYGLAMVGGTVTAFDNPARRAFAVEMVPESDVPNAASLNTAMMTAARVIGPATAGILAATVGFTWCFAIDGLSYFAVIYGLAAMNVGELRRSVPPARAKRQVREGVRYARSVPDLWIPLVMTAVIGTFAFNFTVVLQLFVKRTFAGSDASFTLMLSTTAIGALAASLVAARRRQMAVRQIVLVSMGFGAAMFAMAASPTLWSAYLIGAVVGFCSTMFVTFGTTMVQLRAVPAMRGRVLALQGTLFLGSTPIGGPILGATCQYLGARSGLLVGGLACFGAAAWGWTRDRSPRRGDPERRADRRRPSRQDGLSSNARLFMQYRSPVGCGPSGKT